jgi:hypothetical protein
MRFGERRDQIDDVGPEKHEAKEQRRRQDAERNPRETDRNHREDRKAKASAPVAPLLVEAVNAVNQNKMSLRLSDNAKGPWRLRAWAVSCDSHQAIIASAPPACCTWVPRPTEGYSTAKGTL